MTNFRYSQNPRAARKRPSRTAAPRSARRNKLANRRIANDGRPNGWLDGRWVPSSMPFEEGDKFWQTSPDGESRDGYVWLEYHKNSHRSSRRANRRANRKTAWQMWSLESYTDEDLLQSKKELEENIAMIKEWRERTYDKFESETSPLEKSYLSEDLHGYADSIYGDEIHIQQIEEELRSRGIHTSRRANRRRPHSIRHSANRRRAGRNSDW